MSTNSLEPLLRADTVLCADYGRLRARWRKLNERQIAPDDPAWAALREAIATSQGHRAQRAASVPAVSVDEALPIAAEAAHIVELIRAHQVIVIAGETGSGKTTQLPKLCLAAGRGVGGMIGCTQPRRIAARSVARRVAQELSTEVGGLVGFQVRFTDQVGERALIKFMTDGILLAETQGDAWLSAYDTLIIDEAHERSLNIDFLLGYLKRLLARRRDLKLLVTSATIDTARFAAHFGGAPVVDVPGRSFPVELRYRPPEADAGGRARDGVVEAIDEITRADPLGDVLVFLAGEREIRDAHLALERRRYRETEVLPLYARLSAKDQDRVFNPGPKRRIVLATNVAETSLTVPRIRYVVDPGEARVNRYSHRHKVQRLHIEPISQASADQRMGRCGRVGPGVCFCLYSADDYSARPRYTDPELLRSSLAGVILRLMSLKLGAVEEFPFIDPPAERAIAEGYQQLIELGALSADRRALTAVGQTLARWPIDVKLARMLVAAHELGALRELTVLAAFLSIQDPRERPAEAREAADTAHRHYADKHSDFVGILRLWDDYRVAHEELTQSKLRDWCAARFLSFLRMREWRELHRQLLIHAQELGWTLNDAPAKDEALHRALLSGLPGNVARKDEKNQYDGTRGRRYTIFPGSGLAKTPPVWLLSAVLLDTQRLYGLTNARVEPEWIEQQARHLVKHRYYDPHWSRAQGRVLAYEQVTLFGLSLVERRRVNYASHDPVDARAVFIREALVTGEINCRAVFVARNRDTLERARAEEAKRRRHGLMRDDAALVAFFEDKIPADMHSAAGLDAWYRKLDGERRRALEWTLADVLESDAVPETAFPPHLRVGAHKLRLDYRFEPGHIEDGVILALPLALLNAVRAEHLDWLVPGLLADKVAELIRSLPKPLRRNLVPAPDFARAFVADHHDATRGALLDALCDWVRRRTGVAMTPTDFDPDAVPTHLRMNVRVLDAQGAVLAQGRDLSALQAEFGERAREQFARQTATSLSRVGLTRFELDEIPERVDTDAGLSAFPALVDTGVAVDLRVYERAEDAARVHGVGVLRLARLALADKLRGARKQLPLAPKLALAYTPIAAPEALREDVVEAAFLQIAETRAGSVRTRAGFDALCADVSRGVFAAAVTRLEQVEAVLAAYAELLPRLTPPLLGFAKANYDDLRAQLAGLVFPGFARVFTRERMAELPRYLTAMRLRAERLQADPRRDQARMLEVQALDAARHAMAQDPRRAARAERLRWLIEEYRVQLFAQELKTREPVSDKRLRKLIDGDDV